MKELTVEQKANIQRLSDAMRAGAAIRPQATGVLFRAQYITQQGRQVCSCALGAAWEGAHPAFDALAWLMNMEQNTTDNNFIGLSDIEAYFDLKSMHAEVLNPVSGSPHDVIGAIIDLNDRAKWTREEIADWLLTLV